jgi:cytochrome c-type biogenesis protein CcmH/NrfG
VKQLKLFIYRPHTGKSRNEIISVTTVPLVIFSYLQDRSCRMKTIVRMIAIAIAMAIGLGTHCRAQSTDELEAAGVAHFKKAYYEAIPKQKTAEADEEFRKAETALRKAILQNPDRVSAYQHLGRTLFVQGKYQQAAKVYGDALKIDPENKPAYLQLASAQEQAGDYRGAVATLQMLRTKETDPAALNRLDELIGRFKARQAAPGEQPSSGKGGAK